MKKILPIILEETLIEVRLSWLYSDDQWSDGAISIGPKELQAAEKGY